MMAIAALALTFAACGNKQSEKAGAEAPADNSEASYITYTNEKYGYSVEVPGNLSKRETLTEDNGTIFSADGTEGITFNRIDITGAESMFVDEYTPEKVKSDFEYWTADKEVFDAECGDDYFIYTTKGENLTEINRQIFKGNKSLTVVICYDAEHEKQLSGEVADHVFKSMKFN